MPEKIEHHSCIEVHSKERKSAVVGGTEFSCVIYDATWFYPFLLGSKRYPEGKVRKKYMVVTACSLKGEVKEWAVKVRYSRLIDFIGAKFCPWCLTSEYVVDKERGEYLKYPKCSRCNSIYVKGEGYND